MIKKFFLYLITSLSIFSASLADEVEFKDYAEINECIPFSNDLDVYASNIEKCFNKFNKRFYDSFYYTLGEELPNDFFESVDFGFDVNQYLNIDNFDSKQRIQIDNYLK